MNIAKCFNVVKSGIMKTGLRVKAASPEILLGTGIVCGIAAVVTGCMASRKVDKIIEETHDELDVVEKVVENADTEEEARNAKYQTIDVYVSFGKKMARLYGPTLLLTVASVGSVMASHGILKKRYLSTAAAYKALDEAYKSYRDYVANELGYGEGEKAIAAQATCKDNVKEQLEDGTVVDVEGNKLIAAAAKKKSPYEFDFNRYTAPWTWKNNPVDLKAFLLTAQNYMNDKFHRDGYLFLNDVLNYIGLEPTAAGQVIGWFNGAGDDDIDFGFLDSYIQDIQLDSDLVTKNIHLNFNCDGIIYDMLPKLV